MSSNVDDPQDFIDRMPAQKAAKGGICSVICPGCGEKKTVIKTWPDAHENGGWGTECASCGHFLTFDTYFAESEEVDPENYLDAPYESPVPGYTVEKGRVDTWDVYNPKHVMLGSITYDPQLDVPANANPEWHDLHWMAIIGWRDSQTKFFTSFKEAALFVIRSDKPPAQGVAETLLETDLDLGGSPDDEEEIKDYALSTERGLGNLRTELRRFYDYVGIHVKPSSIPIWHDQKTWIVACRRSTNMPIPPGISDAGHYKNLIRHWLLQWASRNNLHLCMGVEFHGFIRKNVTLKFDTALQGAGIRGWRNESSDDVDPESFMGGFLDKHEWEKELYDLLWQFHSKGVGYQIAGYQHACIVTAETYFEPDKDDFANRMYDFLLTYFKARNVAVTSLNMWTWKNMRDHTLYPRWHVLCTVNAPTLNPTVAAKEEPPIRSLPT